MSPADATVSAASLLLAEFGAFALAVLAGVIVSLITLWLSGRQRAKQEERAESLRREAVLAAIGRELRWNRVATRGKLDADNAHVTVGALATVAFECHAGDLATIAPESLEDVYRHYALVATVREGIRAVGPPGMGDNAHLRPTWIELCSRASNDVSNSATQALRALGLSVED